MVTRCEPACPLIWALAQRIDVKTFAVLGSSRSGWPAPARLRARKLLRRPDCFLEVFVNAPLSVCEERDAKGLYRRARTNEISDFTGISSAYEPPESPEVEVRTDLLSIEASVAIILEAIYGKLRCRANDFSMCFEQDRQERGDVDGV